MRSPFGFGLRPRLLAAFVLTAVVTLGVAALALLSPLEQRLQTSSEATVFSAISVARGELHEIQLERSTDQPNRRELEATMSLLRRDATAQTVLLNRALEAVSRQPPADLDLPVYFPEARRALTVHRGVHEVTAGDELVAARPVDIGQHPFVLVVVKRLDFVTSAVGDVESAFAVAAAAGLGIAVLLGIGLSSRLVRRLRRLRDAASELERKGPTAPFDVDAGNDELGELALSLHSMQERLAHQDAALRAFVATASHELRTPLTSLDGLLELIEDDLDPHRLDLEDARERTARAREQSQRLSGLASDLLDLSRLDAEVSLRSEPVELTELARAVIAEMELRAATEQITVRVHAPAGPAWVEADPGAVARVVRILLDNALRISPAQSAIDVEISARATPRSTPSRNAVPDAPAAANGAQSAVAAGDGTGGEGGHEPLGWRPSAPAASAWRDFFQLVVRDEGPGVPQEERELIFERFRRGTSTAGHGGFGLGLAIGRELTERMGGTLELMDSRAAGAAFALRLPALPAETEDSARTGPRQGGSSRRTGAHRREALSS